MHAYELSLSYMCILADIDECNSSSTNNCDPNALCMNIPGSFTCTCKNGYSGNGLSCDCK